MLCSTLPVFMRPQQRSFVHSGSSARVAHCARQELRFPPGVQYAWFVRCLSRRNALLFSIYLEYNVLAVNHDRNEHTPKYPLLFLDLTDRSGQAALTHLLQDPTFVFEHLGPPCGAGSRAPEKPVNRGLRKRGAPEPPVLRDADHLLGRPNLSAANQLKVEKADALYEFVEQRMHFCYRTSRYFVIENPARAWLWSILALLVSRRSDSQYSAWFNALLDVDFQNCEHGGARPKSTRFKTNCVRLQRLARECTRSHTHAPFAARLGTSGWVFDTSLEAEYPLGLCTAYCRIL